MTITGKILEVYRNSKYDTFNFKLLGVKQQIYIPQKKFLYSIKFPLELLPELIASTLEVQYYKVDDKMASGQICQKEAMFVEKMAIHYNSNFIQLTKIYSSYEWKIGNVVVAVINYITDAKGTIVTKEVVLEITAAKFDNAQSAFFYVGLYYYNRTTCNTTWQRPEAIVRMANEREIEIFYQHMGEYQNYLTRKAYEDMARENEIKNSYLDAFEGDPGNIWNID